MKNKNVIISVVSGDVETAKNSLDFTFQSKSLVIKPAIHYKMKKVDDIPEDKTMVFMKKKKFFFVCCSGLKKKKKNRRYF